MKSTIISHFYNEEYLLPFWLKHHRNLFDHGVLIDWDSTDRSVEICRELVPHWTILKSKNKYYHRSVIDPETIAVERSIKEGWKFCCTITEFVFHWDLNGYLSQVDPKIDGVWLLPMVPIDQHYEQGQEVKENIPLVLQRTIGGIGANDARPTPKGRLIHRVEWGYWLGEGLHDSALQNTIVAGDLSHIWFGYSPWNEKFIKRKLQIQDKMSDEYKNGIGKAELGYHICTREELEERYINHRSSLNANFFDFLPYCEAYKNIVLNMEKFL